MHPYHMHTFGAVVVLLELKPVVWSSSVGSIKLFCEPRFFFPRAGRRAKIVFSPCDTFFLFFLFVFSHCAMTIIQNLLIATDLLKRHMFWARS